MVLHGINFDPDLIAEFCRRHHIRRFSLFGSILTDRFGPESDVDVLVEFEPGHVPGFLSLAGMEAELADSIGRPVDLRTAEELSRFSRERVLSTCQVQYAA